MDHDQESVAGEGSSRQNGGRGLYRLNSNHSSASVFEDVEMAQDEVGRLGPFLTPRRCTCPHQHLWRLMRRARACTRHLDAG